VFNLKDKLPKDFTPNSRVWIYQSERAFSIAEVVSIQIEIDDFIHRWTAHGAPVKGFASVFFNRFIVIIADESQTMVSGCSTDSSVKAIKNIEAKHQTSLFNRQALAFVIAAEIRTILLPDVQTAFSKNEINENTTYFNNTVQTLADFENNWIIPMKNSWLMGKIHVVK
jgi:hypothetical protein